ncbi:MULTISPECIES: hypothetical protein [Pyrobaculum]|uniref:DUF1922 domain-containing protein n=2 Tax=Pyrobaculum arsenaticum TaxID=121277 RepID=A4WIJ3_PYRAR|nr:hypothetical protein [Pyrobaculum arsenaticum]ABP50210.1 conserved hypothetical protein [Pyrobaculum arsenaticum DSM 13514]MCY0889895.1 hypothetical protein [Pyrobaculum arsenaticum]NYR14853.1 hypothetical protein [Pyrobaculum arsenaticum]
MKYIAVVCPRCGKASAARADAKKHQCPYCGTLINIEKAAVIAVGSAKAVREAVVRHNTQAT